MKKCINCLKFIHEEKYLIITICGRRCLFHHYCYAELDTLLFPKSDKKLDEKINQLFF